MKYRIAVALFALYALSDSFVAAQQPSDQPLVTSGPSLRIAQTNKPNCPNVVINLPKHKVSRDELDNKLSKNFKWDPDCVAKKVGLYNQSIDGLEKRLSSKDCDATLTQTNVQQLIATYQHSYDTIVAMQCRHPK
jgi:hypothetical protein